MKIALGKNDYGDEQDDYLLELIGLRADFPSEALDAYGKLYLRYWDIMYLIALKITQDERIAGDLVADTFNMVYQRAATFKKGKIREPDNVRLCIQKWMTAIMRNVFYDLYLDEAYKTDATELAESYIIEKAVICKRYDDDYDGFVKHIEEAELGEGIVEASSEFVESDNIAKVRDYLSKLPDRDRDIILTYYNYYVPGKYTPATVLADLTVKWGTTKENIRKILEKFRKSIREDLQPKLTFRK